MKTITVNGTTYNVQIKPDDTQDAPWDREDGHGPVRVVRTLGGRCISKRPGERVMHAEQGQAWLYDWQAATTTAKTDKWGPTPAEAVQSDFDRLRGWLRGDWWHVGVIVTAACKCCGATKGEHASMWGIESDAGEYLNEVARELIQELA
jgi:hypothetical protein